MVELELTLLGVIVSLFYSLILDGLERKIRAKIQSRKGPPITQTLYDVIKLFRKELLIPSTAPSMFMFAPIVSFSMIIIAYLILPYGFPNPMGFYGDLILLVYLIVASTILLLYGGSSSGNPYAEIGCSREISLLMANELIIALVIATIAIRYHALSLNTVLASLTISPSSILIVLTLLLYIYIESARLPFDIGEAEPEIASGYLIEYSGPLLGLTIYTHILKRTLLYLFTSVVILGLVDNVIQLSDIISRFVTILLFVTLLSILYSIISNICGRFRVRHAVNAVRAIIPLPVLALILSFLGL